MWRRLLLALASLPIELRLILVLGALLHGIGLGWGMPASDAWDVDGVAPRDIIPGLVSTFSPGDYYTYPPLELAIVGVLTLPVTLLAVVNAGTTSVPAVIQEIVKPPYMTAITLTARLVTLLMSLGIVVTIAFLAGDLAPRERRRPVAAFAALFATLNWSFSYYSHTSNLDVPYLFWACLAVLQLERAIVRHEPRRLRRFAVFAALAVGTKDQAYAMFLLGAPFAIVTWAVLDSWPRSSTNRTKVLKEIALAVAIGLGLLAVIDGAIFNPSGFRARVAFLTGPASKDFEILSRDTHGRLLAVADSFLYFRRHYPPVVAVLPIAGVGVALVRARRLGRAALAGALIPLAVAVSFSICFNVAALRAEERFTLPQMLMAAVFAGSGLDALWNLRMPALRWTARAACTALLGLALVECIRVDATLLAEPRYDAETFLAANVRPTDTIETHGLNVYLPRFPDGPRVVRVGKTDPKRRGIIPGIEEVKAPVLEIEERHPRWIVVNECYVWRFLERNDMDSRTGHVVPSTQRADAADPDATTFFRRLFH
ncbi:MAG: hypothetical protein K0S65_4485, partial [Labilithrix sp.]|nr:hypothetical protein [Labilithrix sp.]